VQRASSKAKAFYGDYNDARLVAAIVASVKCNINIQHDQLRQYIYDQIPSVTDAQFALAVSFLEELQVIHNSDPVNPYAWDPIFKGPAFTPKYHVAANSYVRLKWDDNHRNYKITLAEISDEYPDQEIRDHMVAILTTLQTEPNTGDFDTQYTSLVMHAILSVLDQDLMTRQFEGGEKPHKPQQLLIAEVICKLVTEPVVMDYFTVKALLEHKLISEYVRHVVVAENGKMVHRHVMIDEKPVPSAAVIAQRLKTDQILAS
jgi:hypothetical protein